MNQEQQIIQKALFLDRDGIINLDHGYVSKVEDFTFVEGIFDFVKLFVSKGYLVFVVTNQSGIGRGYYTQKDFNTLTQWMLRQFEEKEIHVEKVYHCEHSPEEKCHCRKPETGMIEQALTQYDINLPNSWLVGDKQSDIDLAVNSGIGSSVFIGEASVAHATVHFDTVLEAKQYFQIILKN